MRGYEECEDSSLLYDFDLNPPLLKIKNELCFTLSVFGF